MHQQVHAIHACVAAMVWSLQPWARLEWRSREPRSVPTVSLLRSTAISRCSSALSPCENCEVASGKRTEPLTPETRTALLIFTVGYCAGHSREITSWTRGPDYYRHLILDHKEGSGHGVSGCGCRVKEPFTGAGAHTPSPPHGAIWQERLRLPDKAASDRR